MLLLVIKIIIAYLLLKDNFAFFIFRKKMKLPQILTKYESKYIGFAIKPKGVTQLKVTKLFTCHYFSH